jgi:hypothetical protein
MGASNGIKLRSGNSTATRGNAARRRHYGNREAIKLATAATSKDRKRRQNKIGPPADATSMSSATYWLFFSRVLYRFELHNFFCFWVFNLFELRNPNVASKSAKEWALRAVTLVLL